MHPTSTGADPTLTATAQAAPADPGADTTPSARPKGGKPEPLVSVLVITYEPRADLLRRCISTILTSSHPAIQLVVVDNGSRNTDVRRLVQTILASTPQAAGRRALFSPQVENLGYARATNVGIGLCRGALVLLLNPDAWIEPSTISHLVDAAERHPSAAGFAPKIMLAEPDTVIDSVGMFLHASGPGVQRGLGQADLGQYDLEEPVGGLCFAAALLRREAFASDRVGRLDDNYFMFYDDVDWSQRAQVLGESFWAIPAARVFHFHSASTRALGPGFKTRLIQRNLMWTAAKNLEARRASRILIRRSLRAVKWTLLRREPLALTRALLETWAGLPRILRSRMTIQRRRRRSDNAFLLDPGDPTFFDAARYVPETSVNSLLWALTRLNEVKPTPELKQFLDQEARIRTAGSPQSPAEVSELIRRSGVELSPGLQWMLHAIQAPTRLAGEPRRATPR